MLSQKVVMALALHVEIIYDDCDAPWFKRADLGRLLGIHTMRTSYRNIKGQSRNELSQSSSSRLDMLGRKKNPHDLFISAEAVTEILAQCKKWMPLKFEALWYGNPKHKAFIQGGRHPLQHPHCF